MASLVERFRTHLTRRRLFPAPGTAVVAVSGGPDSVVLLDLLHGVAAELGLALVVAHADHQIRPDSRTVARSVQRLAVKYRLPFELGELGLGPDATETVARRARYAWLRAVQRRRGAAYLVTAHHRDDQAETVLLRMLKGSAPAGLAAMGARGRHGLTRPLLGFSKAELAAHAAARGLPVHEDPANADPRHVRSWLRTTLLPLLELQLGPAVRERLLVAGRHAARERRAWDKLLDTLGDLDLRVGPDGFDVARGPLTHYDGAVAVALLRAAAFRAGIALGPTRARRLVALAARPSGRRLPLTGDLAAEIAFDRLRVYRPAGVAAPASVAAAGERGQAVFGDFRLAWAAGAAPSIVRRDGWTTWVAGTDWEVRAPRSGDRLVPLGGVGRRPLRRLLMEAHVPRSARGRYPVVARGETVLWVPGICRSAVALPQPGTRAVRLDVTECSEPEADRRA